MNSNVYVIVDMQNDFIDGSLKNNKASEIVKPICSFLKNKVKDNDIIIFTKDVSNVNYFDTIEGKRIVMHCKENTIGCELNKKIYTCAIKLSNKLNNIALDIYSKTNTFGTNGGLATMIIDKTYKSGKVLGSITLVGTCTDICVVSNALELRSAFPQTKISVIEDLCAGTNDENHNAAIKVMQSCLIDIERSGYERFGI